MQSLPTPRRPSPRVLQPASALVIAAAIVSAASLSAIADGSAISGNTAAPPAREGNVYDHKDHQPTEAEVRAAERAAGLSDSDAPGKQQVEEEVKKLLDQTDALDRQSERDDESAAGR